jgi:hypothetical protein
MRNGLSRGLLKIFVAPRSLPPVDSVTLTSNKQSQAREGRRLLVNPYLLLFFAEASVPGISGMILLE